MRCSENNYNSTKNFSWIIFCPILINFLTLHWPNYIILHRKTLVISHATFYPVNLKTYYPNLVTKCIHIGGWLWVLLWKPLVFNSLIWKSETCLVRTFLWRPFTTNNNVFFFRNWSLQEALWWNLLWTCCRVWKRDQGLSWFHPQKPRFHQSISDNPLILPDAALSLFLWLQTHRE